MILNAKQKDIYLPEFDTKGSKWARKYFYILRDETDIHRDLNY